MSSYISFANAPLARLLFPLVIGICIAALFPLLLPLYVTATLTVLLLLLRFLFPPNAYVRCGSVWLRLALYALCITVGQLAWHCQEWQRDDSQSIRATKIVASLCDDAEESDRGVTCRVKLLYGMTNTGEELTLRGKALLYLAKDSNAIALKRGDAMVCRGRLAPIANSPNPESFDYARYMRWCGYTLSQYLASDEWVRCPRQLTPTLSDRAHETRNSVLHCLAGSGISTAPQAILTSLLVGYRDDVTAVQQEAYATMGLSHILAVSGLHTAFVLFLLYLLLSPLSLLEARRVQIALTILLLWGYAYLVGLPASVVRVAIMATSMLVGQAIGRRRSALNALCLAAIVMLIYDANQLFLVGFQLSFVATLSILLFQPLLFALLPTVHPVGRYLWSLFTVTLAAQLGTLPLTLYYFHELPLWSLFANMAIVPLLPVVLGAGGLLLLILWMGLPSEWLAVALDRVVGGVDSVVTAFAQSPTSSIKDIYVTPSLLLLSIGGVVSLYLALRYRRVGYLLLLVVATISTIVWRGYLSPPTTLERGIILYHNTHTTALALFAAENNYILLPDTAPTIEEIERCSYNFRLKHHLPPPTYVVDTLRTKDVWVELPYILYYDRRMAVVSIDLSTLQPPAHPLYVDYCIVSKGYNGGLKRLLQHYDFELLLIAANCDYYAAHYLKDACKEAEIPYYDVRESGAWVVLTNE